MGSAISVRHSTVAGLRAEVIVHHGEAAVRLERNDVGALFVVFVQASHDDARRGIGIGSPGRH